VYSYPQYVGYSYYGPTYYRGYYPYRAWRY
jgi:hypothetical protein